MSHKPPFGSASSLARLLLVAALAACGTARTPSPTPAFLPPPPTLTPAVVNCPATFNDGVSPTYKPDAPVRSTVGSGHVLTGVVLSSRDCSPIPHAKLEFWPEYPDRGHPDEARATLYTSSTGWYRFECDPPDHIHMQISAPGFITIGQNSYHPNGQATGTFDIVLEPKH